MGLSRALPLICALLTLIDANTASAAGFRSFKDCVSKTLQNGIYRLTGDKAFFIQATDQELAEAFRGNTQYQSLSQIFSERSLSRYRKSPEALGIRETLIKRITYQRWTGRLYVDAEATRKKDTLRITINDFILKDAEGNYPKHNNDTKGGLKTGLIKALIGIYDAAYSMAAQHPKLNHLEIVADHLINEKLIQALTQMGFYSKNLQRRLTDEEAHAVLVNQWFVLKTPEIEPNKPDLTRIGDLKTHFTLTLQAKITRANDNPRSIHFEFSDLLPIGATEEQTRKTLADQGYTKEEIEKFFGTLSRRLTPAEERGYQTFVRTQRP